MAYAVDIRTNTAGKKLQKFDSEIRKRLIESIRKLGDDPRPPNSIKLTDQEGRRLRVGDYRILYTVDDEEKQIEVVDVDHRKDVYC
jgi:mRNA interferase RelE/StbE